MTFESTRLERYLDGKAHAWLHKYRHASGLTRWVVEFTVFVLKQAWACVFGASFLVVLIAFRLWWPESAILSRNDGLVVAAVIIQILMISLKLETGKELWVIMLFHIVGTGMEVFKTAVGSWSYGDHGVIRIGHVPLYSGFMYAAVGSYMVRVYKLFDLRFNRYPPRWLTAVIALAIYANFFTHHYMFDFRWILTAAVIVTFAPCVMLFKNHRSRPYRRLPLLVPFVGTAFFIWLAENIATWAGAWIYPAQQDGWELVSIQKLIAWFLLMIISVVLVTFVYPPRPHRQA
ncbi:DUF817 domain-containing protein [Brevibacterium paucivorans]